MPLRSPDEVADGVIDARTIAVTLPPASIVNARSRLSRYNLRNGQTRPTTPATAISAAEYTAVDHSQSVILGLRRRERQPRSRPGTEATSTARRWASARPAPHERRNRPAESRNRRPPPATDKALSCA